MKKLKSNIEDKLKELETDVHNTVIQNEKNAQTLDNNYGVDIMIPGVAVTHQSKSTANDIIKQYSFVRKGSSNKLPRLKKEAFIKKCIECVEGTSNDKLNKFINKSKICTKEELLADIESYFNDLRDDMICQVNTMIKLMLEVLDKHIDV